MRRAAGRRSARRAAAWTAPSRERSPRSRPRPTSTSTRGRSSQRPKAAAFAAQRVLVAGAAGEVAVSTGLEPLPRGLLEVVDVDERRSRETGSCSVSPSSATDAALRADEPDRHRRAEVAQVLAEQQPAPRPASPARARAPCRATRQLDLLEPAVPKRAAARARRPPARLASASSSTCAPSPATSTRSSPSRSAAARASSACRPPAASGRSGPPRSARRARARRSARRSAPEAASIIST